MATSVRIPSRTVQRATVGEALDTREAPPHPLDALRAARRDLLAALQSHTTSDLLRPGVAGEPCGRDVLLRMAAWLHELAHLVPDLATYGYQRGEPCDPGPDWSAQSEAQIAPHHEVRPEAAVARVVTAHARLLAALEGLDDAGLRRRGPTRFGVETSGWDLLVAEAAHEREHAARLMARPRQPARGAVAPAPGRVRGGRDDKTWMPTVTHPDRRRRAAPGHHGGAPAAGHAARPCADGSRTESRCGSVCQTQSACDPHEPLRDAALSSARAGHGLAGATARGWADHQQRRCPCGSDADGEPQQQDRRAGRAGAGCPRIPAGRL